MKKKEITPDENLVLTELLDELDVALTDWVRQYAPNECREKHVRESALRVWDRGGTLAYIARLRIKIKNAMLLL